MHEGSITRSLFAIADKSRLEAGLKEVQQVKVVIGKLHHIVHEIMQMHFALQKREISGFENAGLLIEERDIKLKCRQCQEIITLDEANFTCSKCNSSSTEVIEGDELYIESIKGVSH